MAYRSELLRTARRFLPWCRIAVVGNGPVNPADAAEIDAHDMVVRFNAASNYGLSGHRTDLLVICNSGDSGRRFATGADAINTEALASARKFWLTKPAEVIAAEEFIGEGAAEISGDSTKEIVANRFAGRAWRAIDVATYWKAKNVLMAFGASVTDQPSSGLLALLEIRQRFRSPRVTLYGFTHEGWGGHAWAAERETIDRRGWIRRAATHLPPTYQHC